MRSIAVTLVLALIVASGCSDGRSGSGGANPPVGGSGGGGAGAGGEASECIGKLCGDPCYECADPPCSQLICDDFETCQPALDVTCQQ